MIQPRHTIATLVAIALLAACGSRDDADRGHDSDTAHNDGNAEAGLSVVAELTPTEGNSAAGVVSFTDAPDGNVIIAAHVTGLPPGKHGFHIHENGDCTAPDGTSAGGHFNPGGTPHGAPSNPPDKRHVGDLGNITADASGTAHHEAKDPVISLEGPASIRGKALIVHAGEDDLTSQPTGAAGARIACGVIAAG